MADLLAAQLPKLKPLFALQPQPDLGSTPNFPTSWLPPNIEGGGIDGGGGSPFGIGPDYWAMLIGTGTGPGVPPPTGSTSGTQSIPGNQPGSKPWYSMLTVSWSRIAALILGLLLIAGGLYLIKPVQQFVNKSAKGAVLA